jgi:hypothetical protein
VIEGCVCGETFECLWRNIQVFVEKQSNISASNIQLVKEYGTKSEAPSDMDLPPCDERVSHDDVF